LWQTNCKKQFKMEKTSNVILIISLIVCAFTLSSGNPVNVPEPNDFGKELVSVLKNLDSANYSSHFAIARYHYDTLVARVNNDPHIDSTEKKEFETVFSTKQKIDTLLIKARKTESTDYQRLKDFVKYNIPDVSKIEFVRMYSTIEMNQSVPIYEIKMASVYITNGSKYYKITIPKIIVINDKWIIINIHSIEEVNKEFQYINEVRTVLHTKGTK